MKEEAVKTRFTIRINARDASLIRQQATIENVSPSQLIREAVSDRLYRDVSWQGQVQGAVEAMRREIKKTRRDIEILSDVFLHWTEYYFMYTRPFGDISDEQKKNMVLDGRKRAGLMLEAFKKKMKVERPGVIEMLLADYMTEEKTDDTNGE